MFSYWWMIILMQRLEVEAFEDLKEFTKKEILKQQN